jgi:hypothetical protein
MKNKISMTTKMSISMTFNRIFPDLQAFQAWNQQVQISKTFQIFKALHEPCPIYCTIHTIILIPCQRNMERNNNHHEPWFNGQL